jgi:predicted metal-binding membrane protein
MALTFVLGTMNLVWMAALTVFMLMDKVAPAGDRLARASGVGFLVCSAWRVMQP